MNRKWGCTAVLVFVGIGFLAGAYLQYRPALPRKYRPLFEAARAGNAKQVEELLRTGPDPNFRERYPWFNSPPGDWGMSPLHYAAQTGEPETMAVLLRHGADPNKRAGYAGGDPPWIL